MLGFINVDTQEQVFPAGAFVELIPAEYTTGEPYLAFFAQFDDKQAYLDFVQMVQDTALCQHRCAFGTIERQGVNLYVIDTAMWDNKQLSCLVQFRPVERVNDLLLPAPTGSLVVSTELTFYDCRTKEPVFSSHATAAVKVVEGLAGYGSTWHALLFYYDGNSADDLAVLDQLHKSRRMLRLRHSGLYPFTISAVTVHEDGRRVTLTLAPVFRSRVG